MWRQTQGRNGIGYVVRWHELRKRGRVRGLNVCETSVVSGVSAKQCCRESVYLLHYWSGHDLCEVAI